MFIAFHGRTVFDGISRLRFNHERRGNTVGGDVRETEKHARDENLEQGVEKAEATAAKTIFEKIRHGGETHATKPDIHEPEIRVHENGLEREPGAGRALLVNETGGADGARRLGG